MSECTRSLHKRTIVADPFTIPVAEAGSGPQVLVCVNGMQQTMAMWRSVLKRMTAAGYRTVLFDFPNQGRAASSWAPRRISVASSPKRPTNCTASGRPPLL